MTEAFAHVFEPLRLRHRTARSRINFGAHTANMAEGGLPGEQHIGYYRERALGGTSSASASRSPRRYQIGDAVAPRRASLAFFEGRELALRL